MYLCYLSCWILVLFTFSWFLHVIDSYLRTVTRTTHWNQTSFRSVVDLGGSRSSTASTSHCSTLVWVGVCDEIVRVSSGKLPSLELYLELSMITDSESAPGL